MRIITFTSVHGGCGLSTASVVFSRTASALYSKGVLHISFDAWASKMTLGNVQRIPSFETLFFNDASVFKHHEISDNLSAAVSCDDFNVSFFTDTHDINSFVLMTQNDICVFLKQLSLSPVFDILTVDLPFNFVYAEDVLKFSDNIVVVSPERSEDGQFKSYLNVLCGKENKSPVFCFVSLKDPESFDSGFDMYGSFASDVRQLATDILSPDSQQKRRIFI